MAPLSQDALGPDVWRLIAARGIRQFAYGSLSVTLGVALTRTGFNPVAIGAIIMVALMGDLVATYLVTVWGDQWGRRRVLLVLGLGMALTGIVFAIARSYPVLLVVAFVGTLGSSTSETAPFLPVEQSILSHVPSASTRSRVFVRYNLVASLSGALGALAAAIPSWTGLNPDTGFAFIFVAYAGLGLVIAVLSLGLSADVELPASLLTVRRTLFPSLPQSRTVVLPLAGLFSVDAFGGALVVQSLIALFFHLRFHADLSHLGVVFFAANLLSAISLLAAGTLVHRLGLLRTMVFTHLPSNILLILVPFMPSFPLAAAVLLARQSLSQLDVPARQMFTMALAPTEERTAAAGVTSLARSGGAICAPLASGVLLQSTLLAGGLPFLVGGILKSAYDLALWRLFRHVPVKEILESPSRK